jgi:hypothetical protein
MRYRGKPIDWSRHWDATCPHCKGQLYRAGYYFSAPRRHLKKAWRKLEHFLTTGSLKLPRQFG